MRFAFLWDGGGRGRGRPAGARGADGGEVGSPECEAVVLYLPTAAIALQLHAGLSDLSAVPRLQAPDELNDEAARLDEYVQAIRATAKVFETYQHKTETLIEYDAYIVWVDAWLRISGFGAYFVVDLEVRRGGERASGDACASMHLRACS